MLMEAGQSKRGPSDFRGYAERGGFEPPIECYPYNGLANRRLQPLGHLSWVVVRGSVENVPKNASSVKGTATLRLIL